ncbi:hypothetical protein [Leptospira alstonii]|uniref:Uncharacterized protein n=2 Tax=Leptospira alstonii TaxID=28452 RepID=M6D3N5_9LEPT|nr:hypothetical protein [Leptospira alstonii]EMJ95823.1 hypothetical protein LEP1GSC194_3360 [Leptospira alstonii serovar Sichuan str. 79601]EQA79544.1 hypothetical protein LEP1GSC193_0540 [Leptospira alstonii serovar Pingchang str. 80-412]
MLWIIIGRSPINNENPINSYNLDYPDIIINIRKDINQLKSRYPQLADFTISNIDLKSLKISYEYKCHRPNHNGGWTGGVPNPDRNGMWLYISFWDEKSIYDILRKNGLKINDELQFNEM